MRILRILLVAVLLAPAMPAAAFWDAITDFRKPNLKLGPAEIHPYYSLTGTYDDNMYLVNPDKADGTRHGCVPPGLFNPLTGAAIPASAGSCSGGKRGTWIITNTVGVKVVVPFADMHKVSLGYEVTTQNYKVQPKANDSIGQKVDASYEFTGAAIKAKVYDNYINTEDPAYNPNTQVTANPVTGALTGGELNTRERRWQNTVGVDGEYALGDLFFFGADASDSINNYRSPTLSAILDNSAVTFGVRTGYKIQPKTRLYVAGHRILTRYSAGRQGENHKDWTGDVGVEGELTAKLKGRVQVGVSHRRYEKYDRLNDPNVPNNNTTMTSQVGLNFKPTPQCAFDLGYNRFVSDASNTARYYTTNAVNASAKHTFFQKLTWGLTGGVQWDKYGEAITLPIPAQGGGLKANRRDDIYTAGTTLEYKLQDWISVRPGYQHTRRYSIFSEQFNYKVNRTSVGLKAAF